MHLIGLLSHLSLGSHQQPPRNFALLLNQNPNTQRRIPPPHAQIADENQLQEPNAKNGVREWQEI